MLIILCTLVIWTILFTLGLIRYIRYRDAIIADGFVVKIEQKRNYNPKHRREEMMDCYTFEYEFEGETIQNESMEGEYHLGDHVQLHLNERGEILEKDKAKAQMISFGILMAIEIIYLLSTVLTIRVVD